MRGLIVLALVIGAFFALFGLDAYERRTAALAVPQQRAVVETEVKQLALSESQRQAYLRDLATANDKGAIEEIAWKARWDGDPAYRSKKTQEKANAVLPDSSDVRDLLFNKKPMYGALVVIMTVLMGAVVLFPMFRRRHCS